MPDRIGPFTIQAELGRGSAGVVYKVTKPPDTTLLALKVLFPSALEAAGGLTRFRREANALLTLDHPGIVQVYETGSTAKGMPYIALAFEAGGSLNERLRRGPLPVAEAVEIARQLSEALAHAHDHKILHRDLKPHNVLFSGDGRALITDFGLSRDVGHDERITKTGEMLGTPTYMPPEQVQGDPTKIGPASDIYGLGSVLYAMLCGESPFRGDSVLDVLKAVVEEPPRPPSSLRAEIDGGLEAIVLRCLAKEPSDRYPDARALGRDLAAWLGAAQTVAAVPSEPAAVASTAPAPTTPAAASANWGLRFALCGVLLIVSAFGVLAAFVATRPSPEATATPTETASPTSLPTPTPTPQPTPTSTPPSSPTPTSDGEKEEALAAVARAETALKERRFKVALKAAESAVRLHRSRETLHVRARARRGMRLFAGALEDFDALISDYPEQPSLWVERGAVKWESGRRADARADYRKARALDPKDVRALNALGWAAWHLDNDGPTAEGLWQESVRVRPTASALAGLAWLCNHRKDHKKSLEHADAALALQANHPRALEARAVSLMKLGDLPAACDAFERLALRFPNNVGVVGTSLNLSWNHRDKRKVMQRLRKALMRFPDAGPERDRLMRLKRRFERELAEGEGK